MTESYKTRPNTLTKLTALQVSLKMWGYIEAEGVSKSKALEALGLHGSDYLYQCPLCEYVYQKMQGNYEKLPCKEHCPAWHEFSAPEHSQLDDQYPCVENPDSPYHKYPGMHPISLESTIYKSVGRGMVKLLEEALERNLNEGNLNTLTHAADS